MAPGTTERLTRSPFLASVLLYACFASALSSSAIAQADPTQVVSPATFPGTSWAHLASLKEAGWSQEKLAAARAYADADSIHTSAVMIVQGGKVVDQWGNIDKKVTSHSVRKLEEGYAKKSLDLPSALNSDLVLDTLRPDPRFQNLVRRIGLNN